MAQKLADITDKVSFNTYASTVGGDLDCHLTVERVTYDPERPSPFYTTYNVDEAPLKTVPELIAKLRKTLKGVVVVQDKNNPKIVHLIDNQLLDKPGYPITQKASIIFKGVLADLSAELGKSVQGLGSRTGGFNLDAFDDHVTEVSVNVKDQPVRQILTEAVPLKNYNRVLWFAETSKKDGQWKTQVQFAGPKTLNKK
jgi:hypothetical protein